MRLSDFDYRLPPELIAQHPAPRRTASRLLHLDGRTVTLDALMTGNEVLIGQMVLEATDMQVDCTKRRLIPNPAHPDGPVLKLK